MPRPAGQPDSYRLLSTRRTSPCTRRRCEGQIQSNAPWKRRVSTWLCLSFASFVFAMQTLESALALADALRVVVLERMVFDHCDTPRRDWTRRRSYRALHAESWRSHIAECFRRIFRPSRPSRTRGFWQQRFSEQAEKHSSRFSRETEMELAASRVLFRTSIQPTARYLDNLHVCRNVPVRESADASLRP